MSENVYFAARKNAAIYNERLKSRAAAAELLGVSESSLTKYELGLTKNIPVDVVVLMSEVYNAPELKCLYCKNECPIGHGLPIATETGSIESITVRLLDSLDEETLASVKKQIIKIASDGEVSSEEEEKLRGIMKTLDKAAGVISELRTVTERLKGRDGCGLG